MLASLVLCLPVPAARADDQAQVKALLDKAIRAAGGEEGLAKLKSVTWKGKGTLHGKEDSPFTTEVSAEWPSRIRVVFESKEDGKVSKDIQVINGDKGWTKTDDEETMELDEGTVKEMKEWLYTSWVTTLVPLRDREYQLSLLGETKVGNRPVVGLRVSHKGHKDVELFFDKDTGLAVKSRAQVKDLENDKQVTESVYYDRYKDFQGTKQPTKLTTLWDGKPREDLELTEIRLAEKLPEKLFAKP
jgi:hypothetical protein